MCGVVVGDAAVFGPVDGCGVAFISVSGRFGWRPGLVCFVLAFRVVAWWCCGFVLDFRCVWMRLVLDFGGCLGGFDFCGVGII